MKDPCFFRHRWSEWQTDFEEAPEGEMAVFEWRTRECKRKGCGEIEEEPRRVSDTLVVLRMGEYYREAS